MNKNRGWSMSIKFQELKVSQRLAIGSVVLALLFVLSGGFAISATASGSSSITKLSAMVTSGGDSLTLGQLATAVALAENSVAYDYASNASPSGDLATFKATVGEYAALNKAFSSTPMNANMRKLTNQATANLGVYVSMSNQINALLASHTVANSKKAGLMVANLAIGSVITPLATISKYYGLAINTTSKNATTSATNLEETLVALLLVALVAAIFISRKTAKSITVPLNSLVESLDRAATGDLTISAGYQSKDEIGRLSTSLNTFIAKVKGAISEMSTTSATLANSSVKLTKTSEELATSVDGTLERTNNVSRAAENVSTNVTQVAASTEELRTSIDEIARGAAEAARVAGTAVGTAEIAVETMSKLSESSAKVDEVVKVINAIAEQTNLLALNAAIEAARAGEAGKGFAVVASEVKDLAKETSEATHKIANRISEMQGDTDQAIEAINAIAGVISKINDLQTSIASAVEEQSATTQEIGRSVSIAADGSGQIAIRLEKVVDIARSNTSNASATKEAAQELSRFSDSLIQLVGRFKLGGSSSSAPVIRETPKKKAQRARFSPGEDKGSSSNKSGVMR